jgi:predicted XRE-type DNA-binding protein
MSPAFLLQNKKAMKKNANLDDLHIGSMIKEIALQKHVPAKELAALILRYEKNAGKIYDLKDMDVVDVVRFSYKLGYNFLEVISKKYLLHLSAIEPGPEQDFFCFKLDIDIKGTTLIENISNCDFLDNIKIGQHIKRFAEKNEWNEKDMAKLLNCSQSTISDLYGCDSLKVKKLITISNTLRHNFIADVYLSRMFIFSSPALFSRCVITVTSQKVSIENPNDKHFLMVYHKKDN